ncbi:MAG: hypothetical protein AABP62_20475 [Planctomycetota bacterium]
MTTNSFRILSATRYGKDGVPESIRFVRGVNVIVGKPNTGKTRWLETLDFVLGDDGTAEDKLTDVIATKYSGANVVIEIGDEEYTVERRWQEAGAKTKIFISETTYSIQEFRQFLLDHLGIPSLHFPQGDPYGPRKWPELGWRSLFRHMYRRQRRWADFADGQFPSEQHACLLQFVGIAEVLFSPEYGEMVQKEKSIRDLQSQKDNFLRTLHEISRELLTGEELGVAITPDSIASAIARLNAEMAKLNKSREQLVQELIVGAPVPPGDSPDTVSRWSKEFGKIKEDEQRHVEELQRIDARLSELETYLQRVVTEIGRLERAQKAGDLLADLKVTHCPVCDQAVKKASEQHSNCYLCGQTMPINGAATAGSAQRLVFEVEQLRGERTEIAEITGSLRLARLSHSNSVNELRIRGSQLKQLLSPARMATAAVLPPQVTEIEIKIGRCVERVDQLRRIRESLALRETIAAKITAIQTQVDDLSRQVELQTAGLDFETAGDALADGMNEYLAQLVHGASRIWNQDPIRFFLKKDSFRVRVGREKWEAQLGGTMTIYFLLAYHYSLLKLSASEKGRIPGFLMLDFPAEIIEADTVADHENFVIEPFVKLCQNKGYEHVQVLVAGSAFQGLRGAHRNELTVEWKGSPS